MLQMRPTTLRARLILLVTLAVIPVAAGILYTGYEQRLAAIASVERDATGFARGVVSDKERLVGETEQFLRLLAQLPQVRGADPAECSAFLAGVLRESERYANVGVAEPDGLIHCSALPIDEPVDASFRVWFTRAVETQAFTVGDYQVGTITGVGSVNFAYPFGDDAGLAGVVFVAVPLTWLDARLAEADLPPGSEVVVVDGNGAALSWLPDRANGVGNPLAGTPLEHGLLNLDGEPTVAELEGLDGVRRIYASVQLQEVPGERPVVVAVGIPTEVAYAPVTLTVARNLALLAMVLILVVALTWWSAGTLVLRPVRRLVLATQRLSEGDLGARASVAQAPREIQELAASFNEMAGAMQRHTREIRDHLVQISRLSRVRAVLSGINSAILRIRDREELLRQVCRISVEEGEFALAWIAEPDPEAGPVRVAACVSAEGLSMEGVPDGLREPEGMAAAALREGTEQVSGEVGGPARELGLRSAAALPLRVRGRVVGALNLYTSEAGFFTEEEVRLMRELAADTSLGLEYIEKEGELHYLANYDPLTDLPNRTLFSDRLRQAIGRGRPEDRLVAVLLVGIDRFSEINATLGHQVGDRVLQTVARVLQSAVGEGNTASRLGSKDFGVVLAEGGSLRQIELFAERLLERLPGELIHRGERIFLSLRIGVAVYPHDGEEADGLIKAAALALEAAGTAPTEPIAFYSAELNAETLARRRMESLLSAALEREEFALYYQPLVDVRSGEPVGMEALLRWHSQELGEVPPDTFIPVAEEMGIIREIGEWVLATAAAEGRRLHEEGLTELRMNVNVSASQLRSPLFVDSVTRILEETGIDLSRLGIGIEITESELMENVGEAIAALERFRQMGLWVYIDDFGTGYSSLSYLRTLPINSLKIDHSFIHDIPADADAVAVVRGIIALARGLGLRVIAEGVETEEQLAALREFGCDAAQGYLFSPPLLAEQLEHFLSGTP